jgi:hypothetical protein
LEQESDLPPSLPSLTTSPDATDNEDDNCDQDDNV